MLKRRPCRLQTADCADWVLFYLLLINYLVLELHKQEPWYSIKIVCFKPLPLIGVNAWRKCNCRSPSENPPRRTLLGIEKKKKKHVRKSYPNLQSYTLTTMTSVSEDLKKWQQVTGLNYRVKAKTIINNEGNWGNVSRSRCRRPKRVLF